MGLQPKVAILRAMVVAAVLVALPSGAALAQQFGAPDSLSKPKAVKKVRRYFRPTMPLRNPERPSFVAKIDAYAAPSPKDAPGAGASSAAGIGSTAGGQVAVVIPEATPDDAADTATASLPSEAETVVAALDDGDAAPAETTDKDAAPTVDSAEASSSDASDEPAKADDPADPVETETAEEPAETETASSSDDTDKADEATETAQDPSDEQDTSDKKDTSDEQDTSDETDTATDDTEEKPAEVTEVASSDEAAPEAKTEEVKEAEAVEPASEPEKSEKDDETTQTAEETSDDADAKPAEVAEASTSDEAAPDAKTEEIKEIKEAEEVADLVEPAAEPAAKAAEVKPAETAQASEQDAVEPVDEPTETVEDTSDEPEAVEQVAETPVETPSHDATVVIAVTPPPEEVASDAKPEAETASDDAKPIEVAAVTPPSPPWPQPVVPAEVEEPAAKEAEPEPAAEEITDSSPSDEEPETSPSAETASETPEDAKDAADSAPEAAEEAPEAAEAAPEVAEEAPEIVETVPEVVLPPADPVVAAIRATLADPEYRKGVRKGALKALETVYEPHELAPLWITDEGFSANARAVIGEIGNAGEWGLDPRAFDVPDADARPATAESQAAAELKLDLAILKYARVAQGGRLSPKAVSKLFDQRPKRTNPKTVLTKAAAAGTPVDYLLSLHPQHRQFKRLHSALAKARAGNNTADTQRIVINMERWRWMPRQLGSYYVLNNVPEFNTRVVKKGKTIYTEKTIVGQLQYATPFFSASMRTIVFHPDWTVPPTIIKEDLAPKLQKRRGMFSESYTRILGRYGLSARYKGERINADKVDWANENIHKYTFVQAPGPSNVLGQFKFNFPNKHAIYMHDTPQRELFSERVRTLSHGCIRVREPDRLAALLLAEDKGWRRAQIQNLVARGENKIIPLRKPVPVHLTYFTATVGDNGRLQTFSDIYGLDNLMAPKLFDRPVRFQAPAPVVAEADTRSRDSGRRSRRSGGFGNLITGLFGN